MRPKEKLFLGFCTVMNETSQRDVKSVSVGGLWTQGGSKTDANFKNSLDIKPVVKPNKEHKQANKNGDKL